MKLGSLLRNHKDLGKATDAGVMYSGHDPSSRELLPVPHRTTIRRWMVKLDMMTMLFRQWEWSKGIYDNCFIYLGWDASPQLGYDYYVVRETIVTMSEISRDDPNPLRAGAVRGQHRIKPITILGWGETAIEQKLVRLIHSIRLESGLAYDKYRHRVRGNYKGQGSSDRGLGSAPNLEGGISDTIRGLQNGDIKLGGAGGGEEGFLFPHGWEFPGHQHIFYNALKNALTRRPGWKDVERAFRALSRFMSKKGLRYRFCEMSLKSKPAIYVLFLSLTGGFFTWKWEKLEVFLTQLKVVVFSWVLYWDPRVFASGENDDGLISNVTEALKFPCLIWWIEFCLAKGRALGREARWQEGCKCHEDILKDMPAWKREKEQMTVDDNGNAFCIWRRCRAVENALGHIDVAITNIAEAGSPELTEWYAEQDAPVRQIFLAEEESITTDIVEELSQKFDFYKHQPYVSLKVMACYWGEPVVESKTALRALFDWYDGLVNKAECPPCLVIFCEPGIIRAQGEAYLLCHMPLHAFQEAFVEWVAAALNPTTERRLEGIHAMIGVQGLFSLERYVKTPASVCADLRQAMVLQLLDHDDYVEFLSQHWLTKYWHSILSHLATSAEINVMTPTAKQETLYMYSLAAMHKKEPVAKQVVNRWSAVTKKIQGKREAPLTSSESALVAYFKSILDDPAAIFAVDAKALDELGPDEPKEAATANDILDLIDNGIPDEPASRDFFFGIINLNPSARALQSSSAAPRAYADIQLRKYVRIDENVTDTGVEIVLQACDEIMTQSLLPWCSLLGLARSLGSLSRWETWDLIDEAPTFCLAWNIFVSILTSSLSTLPFL